MERSWKIVEVLFCIHEFKIMLQIKKTVYNSQPTKSLFLKDRGLLYLF